ncbi:MAG: TetR/AcrR family transcriptional regulator [Bacillaceae bacterium]
MEDWIEHLLNEEKVTEKKAAILVAAVELISEKGYEKVSTAEIAKRAGVAEGTIFRHFKTKRHLLESIIIPTYMHVVAPMMMKALKEQVLVKEYTSFEKFIEVLVLDRFELVQKATPLIRILFQEMMMHEDIRKQMEALFLQYAFPSLEKIILHFQQKGEIEPLAPMVVFRIISTNVLGYFVPRFMLFADKEWKDEEELQVVIRTIVKALKR